MNTVRLFLLLSLFLPLYSAVASEAETQMVVQRLQEISNQPSKVDNYSNVDLSEMLETLYFRAVSSTPQAFEAKELIVKLAGQLGGKYGTKSLLERLILVDPDNAKARNVLLELSPIHKVKTFIIDACRRAFRR